MIAAKLRHLRIAPRKVRLVADLLRGKSVGEARAILNFTTKKSAQHLLNLLNSAVSGAKNNFQSDPANLYISKITVDAGPKLKRWRARARGSAATIEKKTSHINLFLDEIKKMPSSPGLQRAREEMQKTEKVYQPEKPKPKQEAVMKFEKPRLERGIKRLFRRKVF